MSVGTLLHKIGDFFGALFNGAKKAWKKLSPEIQSALLHGSAVVEAINSNIDKTPDFIIEFLLQKFPDLNIDRLKAGLAEVAKGLKIAEDTNSDDLATLIQNIQKYLSEQKGALWAAISHSIASIFAIAVAPGGTKFAAISSLIEWVYHTYIKKDDK